MTVPNGSRHQPEGSPRTPSSLGTQFVVLSQIIERPEVCDAAGIAKETGLAPSTVRRAITQLKASDLIAVAVSGGYILGAEAVRLGQKLRSLAQLERLAQPVLAVLSQQTGETAVVNRYLPKEGLALVAGLSDSSSTLSYQIELGERKFLHAGASGKVILAFLPVAALNDIIQSHGLPSLTDRTVVEREQLLHDLRVIRSQGYGMSRGERLPDAVAIAAPLFGPGDRVVGSIVVTIPQHRFNESNQNSYIDRLVAAAAELSDQLKCN